jgi:hypothetical protein
VRIRAPDLPGFQAPSAEEALYCPRLHRRNPASRACVTVPISQFHGLSSGNVPDVVHSKHFRAVTPMRRDRSTATGGAGGAARSRTSPDRGDAAAVAGAGDAVAGTGVDMLRRGAKPSKMRAAQGVRSTHPSWSPACRRPMPIAHHSSSATSTEIPPSHRVSQIIAMTARNIPARRIGNGNACHCAIAPAGVAMFVLPPCRLPARPKVESIAD